MPKGIILRDFLAQASRLLHDFDEEAETTLDATYFPPNSINTSLNDANAINHKDNWSSGGRDDDELMKLFIYFHVFDAEENKRNKQDLLVDASEPIWRTLKDSVSCLHNTYFDGLGMDPLRCLLVMENVILAECECVLLARLSSLVFTRMSLLKANNNQEEEQEIEHGNVERRDLTWMDLDFPLHTNIPYLFIHDGFCQHTLWMRSVHVVPKAKLKSFKASLFSQQQPGPHSYGVPGKSFRRRCRICESYTAQYLILNAKLFGQEKMPGGASFVCRHCLPLAFSGIQVPAPESPEYRMKQDGSNGAVLPLCILSPQQKEQWGAEMVVYPILHQRAVSLDAKRHGNDSLEQQPPHPQSYEESNEIRHEQLPEQEEKENDEEDYSNNVIGVEDRQFSFDDAALLEGVTFVQ